jgi:ABC-type nitrate/sulfonate/bicarbonate transport system ATPase subunit
MSDAGVPSLFELRIERKIYRDIKGAVVEAVRDLSLSVAPGEFVCLIGPSGCGKTTALKILLGLDRDFEGDMRPAPEDLSVGVAFQEPRLLPWRTVEQNVRIALPAVQRKRNLDGLFADMGLTDRRGHYPHALSLGLARRASLARALAIERQLLVLDEPFVSLDDRAAQELRVCLLKPVTHHRMSVLMVTHNVREAIELADRLVFLSERPAHVLDEIVIDRPRTNRPPAWIEQQHRELTGRLRP